MTGRFSAAAPIALMSIGGMNRWPAASRRSRGRTSNCRRRTRPARKLTRHRGLGSTGGLAARHRRRSARSAATRDLGVPVVEEVSHRQRRMLAGRAEPVAARARRRTGSTSKFPSASTSSSSTRQLDGRRDAVHGLQTDVSGGTPVAEQPIGLTRAQGWHSGTRSPGIPAPR